MGKKPVDGSSNLPRATIAESRNTADETQVTQEPNNKTKTKKKTWGILALSLKEIGSEELGRYGACERGRAGERAGEHSLKLSARQVARSLINGKRSME